MYRNLIRDDWIKANNGSIKLFEAYWKGLSKEARKVRRESHSIYVT